MIATPNSNPTRLRRDVAIHLVSFADGAYKDRRDGFISEAKRMEVFDTISVSSLTDLPAAFLDKHQNYMLSTPRGFGYWIWKPVVIRRALEHASADDVVIYLDVGFTLNPDGRRRMLEYFDIIRSAPDRMLSFQIPQIEKKWTKRSLLDRLDADNLSHVTLTGQLISGCIFLQRTPSNVDLIHQWADLAVEDNYKYSDDSPSISQNYEGFAEHRHDQSISSILRKMRGTVINYFEGKMLNNFFQSNQNQLPLWATRSRI